MSNHLPHDHGHLPHSLPASIPENCSFEKAAEIFKILSDSKRAEILWLLCHCEECVVNIAALLDTTCSLASHHLKILKDAGLILNRREGRETYYTASETAYSELLHEMIERMIEIDCPFEGIFEEKSSYDTRIQVINEIHDLITKDLTTRYTVEELSAKFHINTTSLKDVFKKVYGEPIATYMKNYRIHRAKELLLTTDKSISEIASLVGYENQSKFTQAFKSITGKLPKDIRK